MAKIETMIGQSVDWLKQHRGLRGNVEALLAATRIHALIDAYEAVGGSGAKWRNAVGVLHRNL